MRSKTVFTLGLSETLMKLNKLSFWHIRQHNNFLDDKLANKTTQLDKGVRVINIDLAMRKWISLTYYVGIVCMHPLLNQY